MNWIVLHDEAARPMLINLDKVERFEPEEDGEGTSVCYPAGEGEDDYLTALETIVEISAMLDAKAPESP